MQWYKAPVGLLGRGCCGPASGGRRLRTGAWALPALVMAVVCVSPASAEVEVLVVSGGFIRAEEVTFEDGGGVRVAGPAGERRCDPNALVDVRMAPTLGGPAIRPGLVLTSGETWSGALRELSAESTVLRSPLLGELRFDRREVAAVITGEGVSATDLLAAPTAQVVLRNGDRIQGQLQSIQGGVATLTMSRSLRSTRRRKSV